MSSDPPPPYPGGPSAPLIEEKDGSPFPAGKETTSGQGPLARSPDGPRKQGEEVRGQPMDFVGLCVSFSLGGYYVPPGPHAPMGYYPPTGPYAPGSGQAAAVLVPSGAATTVTVLQGEIFQAAPVTTVCPHCQQAITTKISHVIGLTNYLLGFFCCFVGCDLGCCLIPCLIDELKDVIHTCPNCKAYIYLYKRTC
uniref:Cell death-inducing p53-target protein 1 n=1 Tax=Salvator merianae TaxID=96440 RepID=A0A8D0B872_SALMN